MRAADALLQNVLAGSIYRTCRESDCTVTLSQYLCTLRNQIGKASFQMLRQKRIITHILQVHIGAADKERKYQPQIQLGHIRLTTPRSHPSGIRPSKALLLAGYGLHTEHGERRVDFIHPDGFPALFEFPDKTQAEAGADRELLLREPGRFSVFFDKFCDFVYCMDASCLFLFYIIPFRV